MSTIQNNPNLSSIAQQLRDTHGAGNAVPADKLEQAAKAHGVTQEQLSQALDKIESGPAAGRPGQASGGATSLAAGLAPPTGQAAVATAPGQAAKPESDNGLVGDVAVSRQELMADEGKGGDLIGPVRRFLTWLTWGVGFVESDPNSAPKVTGEDIRRDVLPKLKPGDTILCGNEGGVTHAILYAGDGKIIHAMATERTQRSVPERIWDLVRAPFEAIAEALGFNPRHQGVITENVDDFFDRFYRNTYVVVRPENLNEEATAKGLEHVQELVGKKYDFDFVPGNDSYYCTEIIGEFYRTALGDDAPRIGGRTQNIPGIIDREAVVDPMDILASPDLQVVTANEPATKKFPERFGDQNLA